MYFGCILFAFVCLLVCSCSLALLSYLSKMENVSISHSIFIISEQFSEHRRKTKQFPTHLLFTIQFNLIACLDPL